MLLARVETAEVEAALEASQQNVQEQTALAVNAGPQVGPPADPDPQETFNALRPQWPLPLGLNAPMPWPTPRMQVREGVIRLERRQETLRIREELEQRRDQREERAAARERELQARERERELLRQQQEAQIEQQRLHEQQRRARAEEQERLMAAEVQRMVGEGTARMCRRCRAGPFMNDRCSDLARHNRDRRFRNHCPHCRWFDANWTNWPVWDGIYGPH